MAKQPSPDKRLVYLHCSSIFSGLNAKVRKPKKISQLLQQHKGSIKILTKESTLPAIAAAAKELLDEEIFESPRRAKLLYPELFQPSETQEAERAASEAEVVRIEAEAAHDIVATSDEEGEDECLEIEEVQQQVGPEGTSKDKGKAPDNVQISVAEPTQSTSQAHKELSFPRLHPVYLPFKTQHRTLVLVQSLLEECCLEFGNIWVPDLMEAQKWYEAESIELNNWNNRFSRYAKSLPPSAMKSIAGKTTDEILFGTSIIRHSAVHRLRTSAASILKMLGAAITFAEALNDSKRAERIIKIKTQLEAGVEEIVQHQNLLERKLTDQLEDIARRRAELDVLENSFIKEMQETDKEQRTEVGSALESFLVGSEQDSNPCACGYTRNFGTLNADSEAGEKIETNGIQQQHNFPEKKDKAQAHHQRPFDEDESFHMTHDTSWHCAPKENIPAEQNNTAGEAIPPEEPSVTASEGVFRAAESSIIASDGEALPENASPSKAFSKEDPSKKENAHPNTMWKPPQVEPITNGFDGSEQHLWKNKKYP